MNRRSFAVALALPVVFALTVLAGRAANGRAARGPTYLSEREAILAARSSDRSIAEVFLAWTEPAGAPGAWLTRSSLEQLGFDVGVDASDPAAELHYRRQLMRRAFVAFELEGPAWQAVLEERARLEGTDVRAPGAGGRVPLNGLSSNSSRLVPVAVDRDADALARRFPDAATHLITSAIVRIALFRPPGGSPYVGGMLVDVDPRRIQVAAEHAANLPRRTPDENPQELPFRLALMYGARWEPWVVGVEAGTGGGP